MTIQTLPDITGCLIARLRSFPAITALTALRISNELQAGWFPDVDARHAVLFSGPVGSPGDDDQIGICRTRYDLFFYGSTFFEAMRLWRTAHPCLCPRQDGVAAFQLAGVRVRNVQKEGGPTRADDPDTKHKRVLATYIWTWDQVPVA